MSRRQCRIVRQGEATLYWFLLIHYTSPNIGQLQERIKDLFGHPSGKYQPPPHD